MAFEDLKVTYSLSQENNGENASVQWCVKKNRCHTRSKQEQP